MLENKDYCDYETCVALKELRFREKCPTYYDTEDNVGLLYNTQWASDNTPYQFTDCLESHNAYEGNSYVDAPTMWEAQKWLREEKRICVEVDCCAGGYVWELCKAYQGDWFSGGTTIYTHYCEDNANNPLLNDCGKYNSYEDALLDGIKEAVKILKEDETN